MLFCITVAAKAQEDSKIIGKWLIYELQADGQTANLDKLKELGKDKDYLNIQKDGKVISFDDGKEHLGSWTFLDVAGKEFEVVLHPSADEKAAGSGDARMTYDVVDMSDEYLVLKLGTIMTTKYSRAKE